METPSTSTMPMVSNYTFDEYLLDIQRRYAPSLDSQLQNSTPQDSQQPQAPGKPPHHYDVYGNPVYFPPIDPNQAIYLPSADPYQGVSHQGPFLQGQPSGL